MAKATLRTADNSSSSATETPSQSVINAASSIKYGTDTNGRKIGIVKPGALLRFRLFKMLGAEGAQNPQLVGAGTMAMIVREIDGERVLVPNTERQLEALIDRLDDPGMIAINDILAKEFGFGDTTDDEEEALQPEQA